MPRLRPAVIALAAAAALAGCDRGPPPPAGDVAASLALPTIAGDPFDPETLRGRPAIVMFWKTNCSYCLNELPVVGRVARARGAAAIAVMIGGRQDAARRLAADFDGTILVDDGTLRARYAIRAVPYTVILRSDGTAARALLGEQGEATLARALAQVR